MYRYEELNQAAADNGISVISYDFSGTRFKGLYCDGTIAIDQNISVTEGNCILAEELGHYYTTVGDITDQTKVEN